MKTGGASSRSRTSPVVYTDTSSAPSAYREDRSERSGTDEHRSKPGPKKGKKKKEARLAREKAKAEAAANAEREEFVGGGTSSIASRRLPTASSRGNASAGADSDNRATGGYESRPSKKSKKSKNTSQSQSLPDSTSSAAPSTGPYSAQAAVNDMMRRALEEDQYSALGSIVDTDSSNDDDDDRNILVAAPSSADGRSRKHPSSGSATSTVRLDRNVMLAAMRKRLRIEAMKGSGNVIESKLSKLRAMADAGDFADGISNQSTAAGVQPQPQPGPRDENERDAAAAARGRKKKKNKRKRGKHQQTAHNVDGTFVGHADDVEHHDAELPPTNMDSMDIDEHEEDPEDIDGEDESSIFAQTTGSSNATWVECDKCKKWRRLRGVVDAKKLPSKWYCHMNKNDPERAKCTAPEEEYETPNTPESATDQRTRKHLRLWVRRLQCNEAYEARLPTMTRGKRRSAITSAKEPYEWVRCCNPSCGKWRALLRFMDASSVVDNARNGEWYCVLNTWDEKTASCAAPQENLPAIGCPSWVMQDQD